MDKVICYALWPHPCYMDEDHVKKITLTRDLYGMTAIGASCGLLYQFGAQGSCDILFVRYASHPKENRKE
ncbi:hypothetical protein Scep_029815 [Stephania cephalantha]|uniref:Uncharacterized protein n=1 Tax=Stephania cephalantha TaxID=152367 RepID=A0AAP0DYD8_9MAGN